MIKLTIRLTDIVSIYSNMDPYSNVPLNAP